MNKVRSSLDEVKMATELNWTYSMGGEVVSPDGYIYLNDGLHPPFQIREPGPVMPMLTASDCKAIAYLLSSGQMLNLRHLTLRGNTLGPEGAQHLASALATNTTLHGLDLSETNVQAEGARHICNAIRTNHVRTALASHSARVWSTP